MKTIVCLVACTNSNGDPELIKIQVECTQKDIDNGEHYKMAKEAVEKLGCDPCWVADETNAGFNLSTQPETKPAKTVCERILIALAKAETVKRYSDDGLDEADFINGNPPEESDEEEVVMEFPDGTQIKVSELEKAEILSDGQGFTLNGDTFRPLQYGQIDI